MRAQDNICLADILCFHCRKYEWERLLLKKGTERNVAAAMSNIIDIHTHVLYGIDDGAQSVQDSINMLSLAVKQGVNTVIATPHYHYGRFTASPREVQKKISDLQNICRENRWDIRLYAGNEIYYHSEVPKMLEHGELLTLADSRYVLLEFSPAQDFWNIRKAVGDVQNYGFLPVIAHVERYKCFYGHLERLEELRQRNCLIQMNSASICGRAGLSCRLFCRTLLKKELVDMVASDMHDTAGRAPDFQKATQKIIKYTDEEYAKMLLAENAAYTILKNIHVEV